MVSEIVTFLASFVEQIERLRMVETMSRMDDRLLADIGLRRDQLDGEVLVRPHDPLVRPDILRLRSVIRPSLQGCG